MTGWTGREAIASNSSSTMAVKTGSADQRTKMSEVKLLTIGELQPYWPDRLCEISCSCGCEDVLIQCQDGSNGLENKVQRFSVCLGYEGC